jgi:predicted NUDIX family NTP pyrophosphohydrolase
MAKKSAGLLMYRFRSDQLEVFLVHPGGPLWEKKDFGSWSIPKGEYSEGEDAFAAAKREFFEETGFQTEGDFKELGTLRQPSGKRIIVWAVEGNCDVNVARSNTFNMEWPPHSGQQAEFPEVDRAEWFSIDAVESKILIGQFGFIDKLCALLGWPPPSAQSDPLMEGTGTKEKAEKKKPIQRSLF